MPTREIHVRIPQVQDIENAVRIYYERIELSSADIESIFGKLAHSTVAKLKTVARAVSTEKGTPIWNARNVNTEDAFKAWGLDITDLEMREKKLYALNKRTRKAEVSGDTI